jgi:hypothetical protein
LADVKKTPTPSQWPKVRYVSLYALPIRVIIYIPDSSFYVAFTYDADNRIQTQVEADYDYLFYTTYQWDDANRSVTITMMPQLRDGNHPLGVQYPKSSFQKTVFYDSNGRWTKTTYATNSTQLQPTYTKDGKVSSILSITAGNSKEQEVVNTFTYKNGNIIQSTLAENEATTYYEYYTDKPALSSLPAVLDFTQDYYMLISQFETPVSKNLVKKTYQRNKSGAIYNVKEYTYEFNAEGYPTKITIEEEPESGSTTPHIYSFQYTYTCQ